MRIRVISYNIHKCIGGLDRRYDPERVLELLRHHQPDVLLLQEVDSGVRRSNHHHQVDLLARELGMTQHAYAGTVPVRSGGQHGNAVLSRFPVLDMNKIDLSIKWKKPRSALHVRLRVRLPSGTSRTLHVYNLHLGLAGFERKLQLRRFLDAHPFRGLHHRAPIVVGGDLNDLYGTLGPKLLEPAGFRSGARRIVTFPAYAPVRALDGLYVRGDVRLAHLERSHHALGRVASDHLPLVADIDLV
jgi:endonuclease/exonuclease/phosphatase family metal-dependent hydrolase